MYFIKIRNASYYRIGQGQYGGHISRNSWLIFRRQGQYGNHYKKYIFFTSFNIPKH